MGTKGFVILILWAFAAALLFIVGADIYTSAKYNLVALALSAFVVGFILDKFWTHE